MKKRTLPSFDKDFCLRSYRFVGKRTLPSFDKNFCLRSYRFVGKNILSSLVTLPGEGMPGQEKNK